jgi:hypothetical protein
LNHSKLLQDIKGDKAENEDTNIEKTSIIYFL